MHVFAMLKWTATILLVYISECRGRSVDQENTSCVYSFHVPGSQVQAGCPGNGQSSEVFRLTESLTQVHHVLEKLQCAFEVLQAKNAELDAKNAELDAKNGELDAKNAHVETKMRLLWEDRDNIGEETKQHQKPTNGQCSYKALANARQFESLASPGDIFECEQGFKFVDLDDLCKCMPFGSNPSSGDGRKYATGGVVYVRWGRQTCPGNASLVYSGVAGGSYYTHKGGGSNYQCLPRNPEWGRHTDGLKSGTYMYGAEYEFPTTNSPFLKTNFAGNLLDNDVPCAVCHVTERHVKVMIPALMRCPDGWTREYRGYLTSSHYQHTKATFECMDEAPEVREGGSGNKNGALFYTVEADCGYALPCPNYIEGWALTCVVCTK